VGSNPTPSAIFDFSVLGTSSVENFARIVPNLSKPKSVQQLAQHLGQAGLAPRSSLSRLTQAGWLSKLNHLALAAQRI
jgi:hypothetical protein